MWEMKTLKIEQEADLFFNKVTNTLNKLDKEKLVQFINLLLSAYRDGRSIFVFGNAGSGDTASHFCGDFLKGVSHGLDKRFKIICLNDNRSAFMAIANDVSYEDIFTEQLKNFLRKEDIVIGISCSGNSANVIKALAYAKEMGATTVAFCGFDGGKIKDIAHLALHADIDDMEISEDIHLIITHLAKQIIIKKLKG